MYNHLYKDTKPKNHLILNIINILNIKYGSELTRILFSVSRQNL